jgi:transglutaminase-like putative cysteine protease
MKRNGMVRTIAATLLMSVMVLLNIRDTLAGTFTFSTIYQYDPALEPAYEQAIRDLANTGVGYFEYSEDPHMQAAVEYKFSYSFYGRFNSFYAQRRINGPWEISLEVPAGSDVQTETQHHFEAEEKVGEIATQTAGMDNKQKTKWIHDYVCNLLSYDHSGLEAEKAGTGEASRSVYDALTRHKGVCDGYARTFYAICSKAGVPVKFVSGDTETNGSKDSHAWNEVNIDGTWKEVDCCWDDCDDKLRYDYYLKDLTYSDEGGL